MAIRDAAVESGNSGEGKGKRFRLRRSGFFWDAAAVATSRISVRAAQFVSTIIIARLLGPEGRGLVSALTVPAQLSVNLSEMGIRQSTAYHLGRRIFPLERVQPTLLALIPIASLFAIVASLIYFETAGIAEGDWLLRALAVAVIPLMLITSYASGIFLGRQRIAAFARTSWRPAFLNLLLLAVLGWVVGFKVHGVLLAAIAAAALGGGYALYLLSKEGPMRPRFDREVAAKLQRQGISYAASLFILMLNYKIMILLLTYFGTMRDVGIYAQAAGIAELIWEVPTVLGSLVLSRGVNAQDPAEFSRKVLVLARFAFLVAVAVSGAVALVAPFLFPLLFGQGFAASATVCTILLPGVVAFIIFKVLNIDLAGRGMPWATMMIMAPVLLTNIGLGWWLILRDGVVGAAWASSISYVVAAIAYILLYSRMVGIPLREILMYRRSDFELLWRVLPFKRN